MVGKTLMLTGGMSVETVIENLGQASNDKTLKSLNLVSYDFDDSNKTCERITTHLVDLIRPPKMLKTSEN